MELSWWSFPPLLSGVRSFPIYLELQISRRIRVGGDNFISYEETFWNILLYGRTASGLVENVSYQINI